MKWARVFLSPTSIAIAAHVFLFVATGLYMKFGSHPDWGAASWSMQIYYDYSTMAVEGRIPYRDYLVEYPILSFPLFLIPRLLVSDFASYRIAFAAEMLAFDIVAIVLIERQVARREGTGRVAGRLAWYTVYCAILSALVVGRFELAPMALCFAAACWSFSGRPILGGFTAASGALMKIFPALVAVLALIWEASHLRASRGRGTLTFACTLGIGLAAWFALGGPRVLESFQYHHERGLGIESIYAGALLAEGKFTGVDVPWVFEHKACHLVPEWGSRMALLSFPLQVVALLLVMARVSRSNMADRVRYSGAAVLGFITFAKVLSPQYLIWLFPFIVTLGGWTGSRARWLFFFCCIATALIYPGPGFAQIQNHQSTAIFLLNLRNVLLIALLVLIVYGPEGSCVSPTPPTWARGSPGT